MHAREKVIGDLYWGSGLYKRGGVNMLVCLCLGERTTCVCVWGGWLHIESEVSIFEGL